MKCIDERIIEYVKSKHKDEKDFDLQKFLNPSLDFLRDVNKLNQMQDAVTKIKKYISENKKILVYGDYDCDGVCASTILYLYLKSVGVKVDVFMPNRFENGYGISVEAIEEIMAEFEPDLIITVDLGITAVEEVEILKQEGVDIVVTDHHLPLEEVPDCIIVDPKYNNVEYGFDGLCGAGVALKLVEALSNRQIAEKYLDICAIATIGDIVPLIDENRAIAKFGLEKINNGECLKSLTFLKNKLEIEKITSTDVSFKIVPRLNACGRMDNAFKVFNFLIQTDEKLLEESYNEIDIDNNLRLATIDKGNKIIENLLDSYDVSQPSILICGDFHEGTVGIVASKVCHDYNKPTIIFAKTENGTLKGSGRSIAKVDLHKIISTMSDKLINFGGHKMAVGLEIEEDYFDEFKKELNQKILEVTSIGDFVFDDFKPDIEILEDDLNLSFAKQLEMLEPFGEENEKPVLSLTQLDMNIQCISEKSFKHYKCFTSKNIPLVAFNFYGDSFVCGTKTEKQLQIDMLTSLFKGKEQLNLYLKSINIKNPCLSDDFNQDFMSSLYNLYYSVFDFNNKERYHICDNTVDIIKQKFNESNFGTIVVASTKEDLELLKDLDCTKYFCTKPYKNGQNAIVFGTRQIYNLPDVKSYKNIIFLHHYFDEEHLYFSQKLDTYETLEKTTGMQLSFDRETFAQVYKLVKNYSEMKANDVLDFANKLSMKDGHLSSQQILFCLIVFMELNFIEFDEVLFNMKVLNSKKAEITSSKFYQRVK